MPKPRRDPNEEFALYKGDNLITIGTIDEIAEERGVSRKTILFYLYPTYTRDGEGPKGRLRLIRMDDDDE